MGISSHASSSKRLTKLPKSKPSGFPSHTWVLEVVKQVIQYKKPYTVSTEVVKQVIQYRKPYRASTRYARHGRFHPLRMLLWSGKRRQALDGS